MLAAISGYAALARRKVDGKDGDLVSFIDTIIEASKRASDLTAKLLAFGRRGAQEKVAVDMHRVVDDVVKLLERTIDKRIEMTRSFEARSATVLGDPTQLQNAVLNLAVNARDAMPKGGTMTFATRVADGAGTGVPAQPDGAGPRSYLVLSVSDNGTGMDEATRARIFEPFFTTKEPGRGTGLGLASVYGTVKNHAGTIEVDSLPGRGTTFSLYLPLAESAAPAIRQSAAEVREGSGRILVVDDEELVRQMSVDLLGSMGYSVTALGDPVEALEFYRREHRDVDLVIVDMMMPRMSGADFVAEIRRANPQARIVVATGHATGTETQKIITRGIAGFVQKPFEEGELSQVIAEAML